MKPAEDPHNLESTEMSIEEVMLAVYDLIEKSSISF